MTTAPGDTAEDAQSARAASPEATGGIGPSYEHVCIAAYLSALLTATRAPVCPGTVTSIALQQRPNGRPLDDVVIGWKDDAGRDGTLDLQLKRRLAVSDRAASDFARIVADAWETMQLGGFVDRRDLAGGLSEIVSSANLNACQKLRALAGEFDPAGFSAAVATQVDGAARTAHAAVAAILTRVLGASPSAEDQSFFWRNFVVGRLEATDHLGIDRLRAIDALGRIVPSDGANPTQLFAVLEAMARQLNVHAAQVDRDAVTRLLAERFGTRLSTLASDLPDALGVGRQGAAGELAGFRDQSLAQVINPVFTVYEGEGRNATERVVALDAFETELRASRSVVVAGEPGAGKSTALAQIALTLLADSGLVPIVRSLPSLAISKKNIVSQICGIGSFACMSEVQFASLARTAQIVLLLDGWNELNPEQRLWSWAELDALRRDFPSMLLVIATRAGTASPFAQATTLEIHPLDRTRQLEAAARLFGSAGHDLVIRARAVSALRPLLRTPLLLAAIIQQGSAGDLPTDRESVIAGLVSRAGGPPPRREQLRVALDGQHDAFLQAIADLLMSQGTTVLAESALLPRIGSVAADLRSLHLLAQPLSAQAVLDLLISHHLLVGIGAPGERTVGFQHQLIQEWYASHSVQATIEAQGDGTVDVALRRLIDLPFWSVTILFAVDRLSRSPAAEARLRTLVLITLGIEPFLAAEMFVRVRAVVGPALDEDLIAFAERWNEEDPARATRFMLATGLKQFADRLWARLKSAGEFAFDLHRSNRTFPVSALEPDWDRYFPELDSQTRRVLLIDIVEQGDAASLALCLRAATKDRSSEVVSGVIDYLDFRDERAALERLLDGLPKTMWIELASQRMPDAMTDRHRACWQRLRRKRFKRAEGLEWINLALEFDCATPASIVEAALDFKSESHWSSYELEQRLFERFPSEFQASLVSRLLNGGSLPYQAWQYLGDVEPAAQSALLAIAQEKDRDFRRRQVAARLLGSAAIAGLVDHMTARAGDREAMRAPETQEVRDVLRHVRLNLLIANVLGRAAGDATHAAVLASVIADWRGVDDERRFAITPQDHETLIARVEQWAALLLAQEHPSRYDLAELARIIDRLADVALLPVLMTLWDRDRTQQADERAAYAADPHSSRAREAHMGYGNQYRAAAGAIGGDAVIAVMTERLDDPDCEHDVAIVLGRLLEVDPVEQGPMGPKMSDLATHYARLLERRTSAPHPVAAKLLDRIEVLVAIGDVGSISRAFQLAGPVTLMNYGDRGASFLKLIEAGKDNGLLRDFCTAFAERGEPLPAAIVRHGIAAGVAALAAMKWVHENDYWRVEGWLRLIAFADDTEAALPSANELPVDFSRPYRARDLVCRIGYSISPKAVAALDTLLRRAPELFNNGWPEALARIGTPEAGHTLLNALQAAPEEPQEWRDTYALRQALAALLEPPGELRTRAMALLGESRNGGKRAALADALAQTMDEEEAIKLLAYALEPEGTVIASILVNRLEQAAVSRLPIEGLANTFELDGAPLPQLRRAAFQHLLRSPENSVLRSCLQAIDHLRDEYGKPVTEPYHPDIDSGQAWPTAAARSWSSLTLTSNEAVFRI